MGRQRASCLPAVLGLCLVGAACSRSSSTQVADPPKDATPPTVSATTKPSPGVPGEWNTFQSDVMSYENVYHAAGHTWVSV